MYYHYAFTFQQEWKSLITVYVNHSTNLLPIHHHCNFLHILTESFVDDQNKSQTDQCSAKISGEGGCLPLHLTIESAGISFNNWVDLIAHAAYYQVLALQTRLVMETRFYPFPVAAIPNYRCDNTSIDETFQLHSSDRCMWYLQNIRHSRLIQPDEDWFGYK